MKTILIVAAALLAPVAFAAPIYEQTQNRSFEDWEVATAPDAWTLEVGELTRSAFATDGEWAVQLRAKPNEVGGHFSQLAQTFPQSETDLPIVPGAFYEFSFDAAGIYSGKGNGNATVTWIGALGHVLRVDTVIVPEATGYESFTARLQAPVDVLVGDAATSAVLRFLVDGQSSDNSVNLWVDDVQFGLGSPA